MLSPGSALVAGLSGGADSMARLFALRRLAETQHYRVLAVHVNHGIRGEEADEDEQFCKNVCREWKLPLVVKEVSVPALAQKKGIGEEECGRLVRYAAFREAGEKQFPNEPFFICTAHNANDSVETMLFHLARGTTLKGMTGIPAVRDNIVRPMIRLTRPEIEVYCAENNIPYRNDRTNADPKYARNRIRNNILPELNAINEQSLPCMLRAMESFEWENAYLEEQTDRLLQQCKKDVPLGSYSTRILSGAPRALRLRALARILEIESGQGADRNHILTIESVLMEGGQGELPSGLLFRATRGRLRFSKSHDPVPPFSVPFQQQEVPLPYGVLTARLVSQSEWKQQKPPVLLENGLDYAKMNGDYVVRNRRPGDRFRPPHRGLSKSLKALFQEHDIPAEDRDTVTLIATGEEILWIEGFGPAEGYGAGPDTEQILIITIQHTSAEERSAEGEHS